MDEQQEQPAFLGQLMRVAAETAARQAAQRALAALGAKGGVIVLVVTLGIILVALLITLVVAGASAALQASTAVWPVSIATDAAGNYPAGGWIVSSRFGWRDDPLHGSSTFHDGIDLASPDGRCPFALRCALPAMFDGVVRYVGWDRSQAPDPSQEGGGLVVVVANGQEDHQTTYAHLEPYRLIVQLQGRIVDPYGRYEADHAYQPIGVGALLPDLGNGAITMLCENEMPGFVPTRSGPGTVVFVYDRPARCRTSVIWPERGDGWTGWTPEDPRVRTEAQAVELAWSTPIEEGVRARDVALRFRARLVPPPPPPTAVPATPVLPTPAETQVAARAPASVRVRDDQPRACARLATRHVRCTWDLATLPTEQERAALTPGIATAGSAPGIGSVGAAISMPLPIALATPLPGDAPALSGGPDCAAQPLVVLAGVRAPQPRLAANAAASFARVRAAIQRRSGIDALAVLADALRDPAFRTDKPGVLNTSWHKAGRAIDLNQHGPFTRVPDGAMFRLFVNGVDLTAIFAAEGWERIPAQGATLEWWHYEYHPDQIGWTSAMRQVWPLATLQAAFPAIDWDAVACQRGTPPDPIDLLESGPRCVVGAPSFAHAVELLDGCGPPVRAGAAVKQLDSILGFVGLTGRTSGPHLHLGLQVKRFDGSWPQIDICTEPWLEGRTPAPDSSCWTSMADPLAFLPLAPAPLPAPSARSTRAQTTPTAILPEGAPYQLPPPNYPGSLLFTPVPSAPLVGQYWSPFADGGQYGGGTVGTWLCSVVWSGFPWCS